MTKFNLKNLICEKNTHNIIKNIIDHMGTFISISDSAGEVLLLNKGIKSIEEKHPILLNGEVIGFVEGGDESLSVASLITFVANKELENLLLADETLYRYKELVLLYNTAEKITSNSFSAKVEHLIIEESQKIVKSDNVCVMLLNRETNLLETVAFSGNEKFEKVVAKPGEGIVGGIFLSCKAEIINNVANDPRFVVGKDEINSMMCAPLKTKNKVLGVISISSKNLDCFTSEDLKLFTTLALHGAIALENAKYAEELTRHSDHLEEMVKERTLELAKKNEILEKQIEEIKKLQGLLPMCANCRKIRNDNGYWEEIELYFGERSDFEFTHGICPDCIKKLYPDTADEILNDDESG